MNDHPAFEDYHDPKEVYSEIDFTDEGRYRVYKPGDYREKIILWVMRFWKWIS